MLFPTVALLTLFSLASTSFGAPLRPQARSPFVLPTDLGALAPAQDFAGPSPLAARAAATWHLAPALDKRAAKKKSTIKKVKNTTEKMLRKTSKTSSAKKGKKTAARAHAYSASVLALANEQVQHATAKPLRAAISKHARRALAHIRAAGKKDRRAEFAPSVRQRAELLAEHAMRF